jgi:hypothetical protein
MLHIILLSYQNVSEATNFWWPSFTHAKEQILHLHMKNYVNRLSCSNINNYFHKCKNPVYILTEVFWNEHNSTPDYTNPKILRAAQSFLTTWYLFSYPIYSSPLIEPRSSLPSEHQSSPGAYPLRSVSTLHNLTNYLCDTFTYSKKTPI